MTRLFTGDYSTGDFTQWGTLQNKLVNRPPYYYSGGYPAAVVGQGDSGFYARYELRTGDVPSFGGGERTEANNGEQADAPTGSTRWYAFSVKFDSTFPLNHGDLGWGITNQWHDVLGPTVSWGWTSSGVNNGYWTLWVDPQSSPGVLLPPGSSVRLLDVPIDFKWHDIKCQICWSADDTVGFVRTWLDGVRQTFLTGSQTYNGRTMIPGASAVHYAEGYYRANGITQTGIVYHTGFRVADAEADL